MFATPEELKIFRQSVHKAAREKITTHAIEVLGGYGYMKDFPVERIFRDAKLTQIFEGTNQVRDWLSLEKS